VFDGYNRGLHWERTCAEISKLRITRGPQSTAIEQPCSERQRIMSAAGRDPWAAGVHKRVDETMLFNAREK